MSDLTYNYFDCSTVADWYFRDNVFHAIKIGGTVLIIAGFILIVTLPVNVDNRFHTWVTTRILRRQLVQTSEEIVELKRQVTPCCRAILRSRALCQIAQPQIF